MAGSAAAKSVPRVNSQRAIAGELLRLEKKIADDLVKIDGYKDALREIAIETGEGFVEDLTKEGLGTVEVKGARAAELKGTRAEIVTQAYYALPRSKQDKLVEQGLVTIIEQWSKPAKPSVTVRL